MMVRAGSVRVIREAVIEAATAAIEADPERFDDATATLTSLDQQRLTLVQGAIVRELLEDLHPDGLAGEDAQEILTRTFQAAADWYQPVDAEAMIAVLMGALGAADPDETPELKQPNVAIHGSLLIADLLTASLESPSPEKATKLLDAKLDHAFAEIQRAETMEMP